MFFLLKIIKKILKSIKTFKYLFKNKTHQIKYKKFSCFILQKKNTFH